MNPLLLIILAIAAVLAGYGMIYYTRRDSMASTDHSELTVPIVPVEPPSAPPSPAISFITPKDAYHAVRVLCDEEGLTLSDKNTICACIFQESQFSNLAVHENKNAAGVVLSTDFGICQINDYWHVKKYHDFASAQDIVANPTKAVVFMIDALKHGTLKQWVSYSSKAYLEWLQPNSPMWLLGKQ